MMVRFKRGQSIERANAVLRSVQPQIGTAVLPGDEEIPRLLHDTSRVH